VSVWAGLGGVYPLNDGTGSFNLEQAGIETDLGSLNSNHPFWNDLNHDQGNDVYFTASDTSNVGQGVPNIPPGHVFDGSVTFVDDQYVGDKSDTLFFVMDETSGYYWDVTVIGTAFEQDGRSADYIVEAPQQVSNSGTTLRYQLRKYATAYSFGDAGGAGSAPVSAYEPVGGVNYGSLSHTEYDMKSLTAPPSHDASGSYSSGRPVSTWNNCS
jgi:hypothetical protein